MKDNLKNKNIIISIKDILIKILKNPLTLILLLISIVFIIRFYENIEISKGKYLKSNTETEIETDKIPNYFEKTDIENKNFVPKEIAQIKDYKFDIENNKITYIIKNNSDNSIYINSSTEYVDKTITVSISEELNEDLKKYSEIKSNDEKKIELPIVNEAMKGDFIKDNKERTDISLYKTLYIKEKVGYKKIGIIKVK